VISTDVDALLNYLKQKGPSPLEAIAKELGLKQEILKELVFSLEDYGILEYKGGIVSLKVKGVETAFDINTKLSQLTKEMEKALLLYKENELEKRYRELRKFRTEVLDLEDECQ
jgi:Mn-dependent DtxR family transcriptional regulator